MRLASTIASRAVGRSQRRCFLPYCTPGLQEQAERPPTPSKLIREPTHHNGILCPFLGQLQYHLIAERVDANSHYDLSHILTTGLGDAPRKSSFLNI